MINKRNTQNEKLKPLIGLFVSCLYGVDKYLFHFKYGIAQQIYNFIIFTQSNDLLSFQQSFVSSGVANPKNAKSLSLTGFFVLLISSFLWQ